MESLGSPLRYAVGVSCLVAVLGACHGIVLAAQLTLTWIDNSTSEQGFSIERSTGARGTYAQIGVTAAGVTTYTDLTVVAGVTYCYRVQAFDADGSSDYSDAVCATPGSMVGLAVMKLGVGGGTVTSLPEGIDCGAACSASYPLGTAVTLTATADPGSTFTGWSGGGCGGAGTCAVTLTATTTVTAGFVAPIAPPIVTITFPTSNPGYTTSASLLTVEGTAVSTLGVAGVSWVNSRGGSGIAAGTTSWAAAEIALEPGINVLTVTARDLAGNTGTASLSVDSHPTGSRSVSP